MTPLRLRCWEGYDSPALLDSFTARHGVAVDAEPLLSDAGAAERIAAGDLCDVLNINNAYVADYLHPRGLIEPLAERIVDHAEKAAPGEFERLYRWTRDGSTRLGVCQRFGPFNLVVNTRAIDLTSAADNGFGLAAMPEFRGRYGILLFEDFNLFHLCIASDIDPFQTLSEQQHAVFQATAEQWFRDAAQISDDPASLNRALLRRDIDFYLSGGVYAVGPARLDGHLHLVSVTPSRGPIGGLGGICFTEITSVIRTPQPNPAAGLMLEWMIQPETAARAATVGGTCNPVAQMGDPRVFNAFDRRQLEAMQWDTLFEDLGRCADYRLMPDHARLLACLRGCIEEHRAKRS